MARVPRLSSFPDVELQGSFLDAVIHLSEIKANAKLDFSFWQRCGEAQRLTGWPRAGSVHVKRRRQRGTHNIVNPGIVRAICQVKSFRRESQRKVLADLDSTRQPH